MQSNGYTIGFAAIVCVVCSLMLSGVSIALKPLQEKNRTLDRQKNILVALGWDKDAVTEMTGEKVQETYKSGVEEMVVDRASGNKIAKQISELLPKERKGESKTMKELPLYKRVDDKSKLAFAYPVTGKGLWSTLYGYLAVKPNGNEIVGLTFYKHGETPGLGAEIEQPWFLKNFVGKELYENKKLVGIEVVKGKAADKPKFKSNAEHMVDGISGATLTGNGVMKMTRIQPLKYSAFFKNRSGQSAKAEAAKAAAVAAARRAKLREIEVAKAKAAEAAIANDDQTSGSVVVPRETDVRKKMARDPNVRLIPAGLNEEQLKEHMAKFKAEDEKKAAMKAKASSKETAGAK